MTASGQLRSQQRRLRRLQNVVVIGISAILLWLGCSASATDDDGLQTCNVGALSGPWGGWASISVSAGDGATYEAARLVSSVELQECSLEVRPRRARPLRAHAMPNPRESWAGLTLLSPLSNTQAPAGRLSMGCVYQGGCAALEAFDGDGPGEPVDPRGHRPDATPRIP